VLPVSEDAPLNQPVDGNDGDQAERVVRRFPGSAEMLTATTLEATLQRPEIDVGEEIQVD